MHTIVLLEKPRVSSWERKKTQNYWTNQEEFLRKEKNEHLVSLFFLRKTNKTEEQCTPRMYAEMSNFSEFPQFLRWRAGE